MNLVKLSFGERFLNWYTHTKLYIRGQKGKDWKTQRELVHSLRLLKQELDQKLAAQLNNWIATQPEGKLMAADNIRANYINQVLKLKEEDKEEEIKQMILDLMDITEQTDFGDKLSEAFKKVNE